MIQTRVQDTVEEEVISMIIDIDELQSLLPHRYPMLMIDRLIDVVPGEAAVGIKNVTVNEPFFQGHFPQQPIFPGVLIVEAMAQTAGALVLKSLDLNREEKLVYFMSIEEAKFRKPVVPGDTLKLHIKKQRHRGMVWKFSGKAYVDQVLASEAKFSAMIIDKDATL